MKEYINIATRKSPLALAQSESVVKVMESKCPDVCFKLMPTSTSGDVLKSEEFKLNGGKGLFIKELEKLLIDKKADIAIHSLKDVPAEIDSRFDVLPVLQRECPQDIMISDKFDSINDIPDGAKIGTSSPRRVSMVKSLIRKVNIVEIRGNIGTRIKKLKKGDCDAIILAAAGMHRLDLKKEITEYLPIETFVPSAGQGILCVEFLKKNDKVRKMVSKINDHIIVRCALEERNFIRKISGDCMSPIGVHSYIKQKKATLIGYISDVTGKNFIKLKHECNINDFHNAGTKLAEIFIKQGAKKLLRKS